MEYKVGDIIHLQGTGYFENGIKCEVLEVENGRIIKLKACTPDEMLGKLGFLKEGEDYIALEWKWSPN